jgi:hypothetical protein
MVPSPRAPDRRRHANRAHGARGERGVGQEISRIARKQPSFAVPHSHCIAPFGAHPSEGTRCERGARGPVAPDGTVRIVKLARMGERGVGQEISRIAKKQPSFAVPHSPCIPYALTYRSSKDGEIRVPSPRPRTADELNRSKSAGRGGGEWGTPEVGSVKTTEFPREHSDSGGPTPLHPSPRITSFRPDRPCRAAGRGDRAPGSFRRYRP